MKKFMPFIHTLLITVFMSCLVNRISIYSYDYIVEKFNIYIYVLFIFILVVIDVLITILLIRKSAAKCAFETIYNENCNICLVEYEKAKERLLIPKVGLYSAISLITPIVIIHKSIVKRHTNGKALEEINKNMLVIDKVKEFIFKFEGNEKRVNDEYEENVRIVNEATENLITILKSANFSYNPEKLK